MMNRRITDQAGDTRALLDAYELKIKLLECQIVQLRRDLHRAAGWLAAGAGELRDSGDADVPPSIKF